MPCKPPVESSPRMQGTLPSAKNHSKHYRIIPADAGSTDWGCQTGIRSGDHPRGCGEHYMPRRSERIITGSSPRMRGAHLIAGWCADGSRIIPADAGSTGQ